MGFWAAGAMALSSLGSSLSASSAAKKKSKAEIANMGLEGMLSRENSQFDGELQYYYKQLARQDTQRGLDQFRKFSTVANYAPQFHDTNPGVVVPTAPSYNTGQYSNVGPNAAKLNTVPLSTPQPPVLVR